MSERVEFVEALGLLAVVVAVDNADAAVVHYFSPIFNLLYSSSFEDLPERNFVQFE